VSGVATPPGIDSLGMLEATAGWPEQVAAARKAFEPLPGLPSRGEVEHVVVLGMGGSGMAGEVAAAAAGPFLPVPMVVVRDYEAPDYVGGSSLVMAVSFSGDTEETVQAAGEAYEAGAHLVVVTAGGALGRLAEEWRVPRCAVPGSLPQPRAALGAMVVPLLLVLEQVGLFPGAGTWLAGAEGQLRRRRDQLLGARSPALEVARRIGRTIPLVHGAEAVGATAARRWRAQVQENAKTPAFASAYPELCHNELAGWGQLGDVTRQVLTVVNLRHDGEHPQVARRFELVRELMGEAVADVVEVRAEGEGELAQLLDLVLFGDFVSLHLAWAAGVDPGPVPVLGELKTRLRQP
jgi:glucose/mannose-6-phosphate isomerase